MQLRKIPRDHGNSYAAASMFATTDTSWCVITRKRGSGSATTASRPAICDIGISNGKDPSASWTVSYATPITLAASIASVSRLSAAKCR